MLTSDYIDAAMGRIPSDTNLLNCRVLDVFCGGLSDAVTVSLYRGYIVGIGEDLQARDCFDMDGRYLAPGLVDAHVHIESSLLAPSEYARITSPRGTVAVIADPHEIANVLGHDGIRWMLRASEGLPVDVYLMAPSCVPATHFDTAGAALLASDLAPFVRDERVLGLGEVMNYPGVLSVDPRLLDKISSFWESGKAVDGHAPGLSGRDLSAYALAGIRSDHEATTAAEALEKLGKGMWIMARLGSGARDLENLVPAMNTDTCRRMMLCTDDRHPNDIVSEGHIDAAVRILIDAGVPFIDALRMASLNTAMYYGLRRSGAIAPGYKADLIAFTDPASFRAELVFKSGCLVAKDGQAAGQITGQAAGHAAGQITGQATGQAVWHTAGQAAAQAGSAVDIRIGTASTVAMPGTSGYGPVMANPALRDSVNVKWLEETDFRIPDQGWEVRVIEARPGSIITGSSWARPLTQNGLCLSDPQRDLLKIFVIERHCGSGNVGKGFIRGLGLRRGAIGSTVSHDSHNMIVAGVDDASIFKAARRLNAIRGGFVYTDGDTVLAELALPIAGLMSDRSVEEVLAALAGFEDHFRMAGVPNTSPLMTLSFMALPVIPELKITDRGLVDVNKFEMVPLFRGP
jgi:adenine deaminase